VDRCLELPPQQSDSSEGSVADVIKLFLRRKLSGKNLPKMFVSVEIFQPWQVKASLHEWSNIRLG
jgi:hypothetical protein